MGKLTPNVALTYTTKNGITYATQEGTNNKFEVGYQFDSRTDDGRPLVEHIQDAQLWGNIRRKAKTHIGLQAELERVIMFYNLIKTEKTSTDIMWHPV
jgi:hypothetical protein